MAGRRPAAQGQNLRNVPPSNVYGRHVGCGKGCRSPGSSWAAAPESSTGGSARKPAAAPASLLPAACRAPLQAAEQVAAELRLGCRVWDGEVEAQPARLRRVAQRRVNGGQHGSILSRLRGILHVHLCPSTAGSGAPAGRRGAAKNLLLLDPELSRPGSGVAGGQQARERSGRPRPAWPPFAAISEARCAAAAHPPPSKLPSPCRAATGCSAPQPRPNRSSCRRHAHTHTHTEVCRLFIEW